MRSDELLGVYWRRGVGEDYISHFYDLGMKRDKVGEIRYASKMKWANQASTPKGQLKKLYIEWNPSTPLGNIIVLRLL